MQFRSFGLLFIFGAIGGLASLVLLVFFGGKPVINRLAALVESQTQPAVSKTPNPEFVLPKSLDEKLSGEARLGSVAVQVFQQGRLIRSGSGVAVSSDGLILTTNDLLVGSDYIQVLFGDTIQGAQIVGWDSRRNVALLKIQVPTTGVGSFDAASPKNPGQPVLVVGTMVEISRAILVAEPAAVFSVTENRILLDMTIRPALDGAQVIGNDSELLGIVAIRQNQGYLIANSMIKEFLQEYFAKPR